ncbi:hypothetical protein HY214_02625 [Candidatus Roizmanbacteria bacterium]|nr:hypothetical protein [Candidatus Roizmanbacteria bacterium]
MTLPESFTRVTPFSKLMSVLLFILLPISSFYLGMQYQKATFFQELPDLPKNSIKQNTSTTPVAEIKNVKIETPFSKRLFDIDGSFFLGKKYPQAVISLSQASVVGIKCTADYSCAGDCYRTKGPIINGKLPKLADQTLLSFYSKVSQDLGDNTQGNMIYCETETANKILIFRKQLSGGGGGKEAIFFAVNERNNLKPVTTVKNNLAYFDCNKPLLYTNTNELYIECGGGEGSVELIYSVDMVNSNSKFIYSCHYTDPGYIHPEISDGEKIVCS